MRCGSTALPPLRLADAQKFRHSRPVARTGGRASGESLARSNQVEASARRTIRLPGGCGAFLDGHTRPLAAQAAGIEDVPVVWKSFESEDAAVAYAIHCQRDRRNLSDADLLRWTAELDKRRQRGGDRKSEEAKSKCADAHIDKTRETIAKQIGVSPHKIQKALTVLDHAAPEVKAQVLSGEKTINKAYTKTQVAGREHPSAPWEIGLPGARGEVQGAESA